MAVQPNGSGTPEEPYQITEAGHLVWINEDLDAHYILMKDIDLSLNGAKTEWSPIGPSSSNAFTGVFDGNGHTISGFKLSAPEGTETPDTTNLAFFGYLDAATVKNVTFANATLTIDYASIRNNAIVAGTLNGGAKLSQCVVADSVKIESTEGVKTTSAYFSIAALAGYANNGSNVIEYCVNNANIDVVGINTAATADYFAIAGIIAQAATVDVRYCINNGNITVSEAGRAWQYVAGIMAKNVTWGTRSITNCINNGNVTYTGVATLVTSAFIPGGVFGSMTSNSYSVKINNCFNFGTVSSGDATDARFGQISGYGRNIQTVSTTTNYGVNTLGPVDGVASAAWGNVSKTADELKAMPAYQAIVAEVAEHLTGISTDLYGYQTSAEKDGKYDLRLVATISGDYTKCQNVGFEAKVTYKNGDGNLVEKSATMYSTNLYTAVRATDKAGTETTDVTADKLGGDFIFVLVCKNLPADATEVTFTVTTFYTTANGRVNSELETLPVVLPGDDVTSENAA